MLTSINPFSGQTIQNYPIHDVASVCRILELSYSTFRVWSKSQFSERAELFIKCASHLRADKHDLALMITDEMGKPYSESEAEIEKCAVTCEYFARESENFLAKEVIISDASESYVVFQPLGPVLAVMPWNFPFWQVFRFAVPALMAGNTGLLKHASNVTGCALAIEKIFRKSGFPEGVFQTLLIPSSQVESVINNEIVKAVTLTGSEGAGIAVAASAGRNLKKSVLELGGSDPFIILNDADLEYTCDMAVRSRFINTGQSCIAAKRFIVEEGIHDHFVENILTRISRLRIGNPRDPKVEIGPLARVDLADEVMRQINESVSKGAILKAGGKKSTLGDAFVEPTLLLNVLSGMPAADEEIFGPVLPVIKVRNAEEAIAAANSSRFGLGASVWTTDQNKAENIALMIESGSVFINGLVKSDARLPFGGIKKSGFGRELSAYGIKEFVNIKTIWRR